jgi:hypothetical protein
MRGGGIMKKTLDRKKPRRSSDELRPEYRCEYSKAKPNRFANRIAAESVAVVLNPDVAAVFKSLKRLTSCFGR